MPVLKTFLNYKVLSKIGGVIFAVRERCNEVKRGLDEYTTQHTKIIM